MTVERRLESRLSNNNLFVTFSCQHTLHALASLKICQIVNRTYSTS